MKYLTKREADSMLTNSLFSNGGSLTPVKLDNAKYKWLGSQASHIAKGPEMDFTNGNDQIKAIWFERKEDELGPYCQVMALIQPS